MKEIHEAILRGLQIFAEAGIWGVDAQHDVIRAGPDPSDRRLSAEQGAELLRLGWRKDDEGWLIFT